MKADNLGCDVCEAGTYAPKILEYNKFEELPKYFSSYCTSTLPLVDNCYFAKKWFVSEGVITTGENSPGDLQLTLGGKFNIEGKYGGDLKFRI